MGTLEGSIKCSINFETRMKWIYAAWDLQSAEWGNGLGNGLGNAVYVNSFTDQYLETSGLRL